MENTPSSKESNNIHPTECKFYSLESAKDLSEFSLLLKEKPYILKIDTLQSQWREWIQSTRMDLFGQPEIFNQVVEDSFLSEKIEEKGFWVYYPWLERAVRILDEDKFKFIRTSRNRLKITSEEQEVLASKTIGVVGLSVGNSAALTLAMERVGGTLRLADFDTLDLSNLNRIRSGIVNLGLQKTVICKRQILELDPFIDVELYNEGIQPHNIDAFLNGIDILVEECDSLPMKIALRKAAKAKGIPVVMDTSDRGMIDVERFDLESDRPLFHGMLGDFENRNLAELTLPERQQLLFALVDYNKASDRAKMSYAEIGKSLTTWPQLASAVALGGAVVGEVVRRILLNHEQPSGRSYVDVVQLTMNHGY